MKTPDSRGKPKGKKPPRGAASPTSKFRLAAFEKQKRALEFRLAGASYSSIAETLGYANKGGAHKAVMAALEKTIQEPADRVRNMELERLDRLWFAVYQQATKGDAKAGQLCLSIMDRRAKLLGLDAPKKSEISGSIQGQVQVSVEQVVQARNRMEEWRRERFGTSIN
jgi:hypothetical protein